MGFLDNVMGRFSGGRLGGNRRDNNQGYNNQSNEYYDDAQYDERDSYDYRYDDSYEGSYDEGGYSSDYRGGNETNYGRPTSMNRFGVDRADYYNDNHAPLVSQSDVRAQVLPFSSSGSSRYGNSRFSSPIRAQDDELAFKDGLARSESSLSQLQEKRLRMENTGRFDALTNSDLASSDLDPNLLPTFGVDRDAFAAPINLQDRITTGQVRQRAAARRIAKVCPSAYGEAEQVSSELKQSAVVVLDLRSTRPELGKRILDFSFGVVSALGGQVERHVDRVYIFTVNAALTEVERAAIRI